jgi:hypothetical protein
MHFPTTGAIVRSSLVWTVLVAALILVPAAVPPARALTDITDSTLPHTADSVLFDWYEYYAPSNVSNDQLGLGFASWHSGDERTSQLFPHWVQIDFGTPRTVKQLNVLAYSETSDSNLRLKDFRFEGSNDGVTYTPLHEGVLQYANRHEWQSFFFQNTTGYRYFRLYGLSNWGGYNDLYEQMIIEEWEMFESAVGACCFPTGGCLVGQEADCERAGGSYLGDDASCDPNPCESTPVENTTWGEVRSLFR